VGLFVSTTNASVDIPELGISIVHPTTDQDLSSQFDSEDIRNAGTLTSVIRAGTLVWRKTAGGAAQPSTDYDADFIDIENENTGPGNQTDRSPVFRDLTDGSLDTRFSSTVVDDLLTYGGRVSTTLFTLTSLNGTLSLDTTSPESHVLTGTSSGFKVVLPDARALTSGRIFTIYNMSSQNVGVYTNNNALLFTLVATAASPFFLRDNSTQAGTWIGWQVFDNSSSGIVNYKVTSLTPFSTSQRGPGDDVITGFTVTPVSGTYAAWYNARVYYTTTPKAHYWSIYKGGSKITDSERRQDTAHSNQFMVDHTMTTSQLDGSQAIDIRCRCDNTGILTVYDRTLSLFRLGD